MENRRRKFIVNRRVQFTILGFSLGMAVLAIAVIFLQNMYALSTFMDADFRELLGDSTLLQMIEEGRKRVRVALLVCSLLILVVLTVGGILLSNRVVGPIYRLQKHMEAVLRGENVGPVVFRKGDFFQEVGDQYNEVIQTLRSGRGSK